MTRDDLVKRLRDRALLHMDDLTRDLSGVDPRMMMKAADRIEALETALHSISLGAQNSMTCKEDLGALARRALEAK